MANLRIHCPVKGAALVNCIHTLQLPLSQLQNKRVNFLPSKLGRKTICTTLVKLDRRAADKFYGQPQPSCCLRLQLQLQLVLVGASQNLQRNSCRPTAVQPVCPLSGWPCSHPAIHKHLQFIAHLPTKYRPIQGTFNGVCGGASSHCSCMGALWV